MFSMKSEMDYPRSSDQAGWDQSAQMQKSKRLSNVRRLSGLIVQKHGVAPVGESRLFTLPGLR